MEYYSAVKMKKLLPFATVWMNLENYAKRNKPVKDRQISYLEGLSKKEKGLVDMDNSEVIAGGRGYKGTKW